MSDPVFKWLDQLGLGQYAQAFLDEDVTLDLLPELTGDDLKEIGVASIGHRRRILTAAKTAGSVQAPLPPANPVQPVAPDVVPLLASGAEQRVVTAMFCDLVGSTQLATRVDPEEYRDLIAGFRDIISETLVPYNGHVARFLGDGIVVFFGLSRSQEHSAENAVAAALDILSRISVHNRSAERAVQVRIGIATGFTVVEGSNADQDQIQTDDTIVGEIPNLAARLQAAAEPDTVVVSQATRDRLGHLFQCENNGVLTLKGIEGGVQSWRVIGHAKTDSRFDALRPQVPTAGFVGRSAELARLSVTEAVVGTGRGQVSLIMGDAGMGKSRLAREFLTKSERVTSVQFILQCTPYHNGTPFHPLRRLINRLLEGIGGDQSTTHETASAFLTGFGLDHDTHIAHFIDVLSNPTDQPTSEGSAMDNRYAQIAVLTDLFCAMAVDAGAVILEDLQWMDASTAEVLARVADRLQDVPTHLVCTMRTGDVPAWCDDAQADIIALDRLDDGEFDDLVRSIARASAPTITLSDKQIAEISARCNGSPVFAEELTRYSVEREADPSRTADNSLPATLADSLLSRLDRLETGRDLAQLAAVIGNEFPVDLLVAVSDLPKEEVMRGVASLIDAGVLQRGHSTFGQAVKFCHMMLQDAAYLTLLRRDRIAKHAHIANTVMRAFPQVSATLPQIVAHHLSCGGDIAHAVMFWDRAGTLAAARSAYAEAVVHFRKAIDDCGTAPIGTDLEETELAVRLNLVGTLVSLHGFNSAEVHAEMPQVEAMGAALQSKDQMLPLLVSKWVFSGASGQFAASLEVARQVRDAAAPDDVVEQLLAQRCMGTANFFSGKISDATEDLNAFFAVYDPALHDDGLGRFGSSHHGAMSAVGLAEIAALSDDSAGCDHWSAKVEELAELSGQAHDLCHATFFIGCVVPYFRDQLDVVNASASRLHDSARRHDLAAWGAYADLFHALVLMKQGRTQEGLALARPSITVTQNTGGFLHFCMAFYAENCLNAGLIQEARESYEKIGTLLLEQETWLSAEFGCVDAMIAHREGRPHRDVMSVLERAEEIATRQGATLFQQKIARFKARILEKESAPSCR